MKSKLFLTLAATMTVLSLSSTAMAAHWQCINDWGGTYVFDSMAQEVVYNGPLSLPDFFTGASHELIGTFEVTEPFVSIDMTFPPGPGFSGGSYSCTSTNFGVVYSCSGDAGDIDLRGCHFI